VGADLVGLRHTEVGVEGQGVQVVLAGLDGVAEAVVGVAEAGVGAGLLLAVADVGGDGVGGGVMGEGVGGAAGGVGGFAQAVERSGFAAPDRTDARAGLTAAFPVIERLPEIWVGPVTLDSLSLGAGERAEDVDRPACPSRDAREPQRDRGQSGGGPA
jgi:hypothetical protein